MDHETIPTGFMSMQARLQYKKVRFYSSYQSQTLGVGVGCWLVLLVAQRETPTQGIKLKRDLLTHITKKSGVDLALGMTESRCSNHLPPFFPPFCFPLWAYICHLEGYLTEQISNKDLLNEYMNETACLATPVKGPIAKVPDGLQFGQTWTCSTLNQPLVMGRMEHTD